MEKKAFSILFVDDEPQNLYSFRAAFRRLYTIHTAGGGQEALELMRQEEVHLVISDQRMPEMTGIEFLEKVRAEDPDVILMILTGYADLEAIVEGINRVGIFRYATKPWDETELAMTIENARHLHELRRQNTELVDKLKKKASEQKRILDLFMKYVPRAVVNEALRNKETELIKAETRRVAVLFCDIRGYTALSETLSPREVVRFLNRYYSLMSQCVKEFNGTVNQYIGDEVFAVFGAPDDNPNQERDAVGCALAMRERLAMLNEEFGTQMRTEIRVGIGINSGEAVAGNMGTDKRIYYSVIGDVVNTGKHIEGLTKQTPNGIVIHQKVMEKVADMVEAKEWEPVRIKGKRETVKVYEILGPADPKP